MSKTTRILLRALNLIVVFILIPLCLIMCFNIHGGILMATGFVSGMFGAFIDMKLAGLFSK